MPTKKKVSKRGGRIAESGFGLRWQASMLAVGLLAVSSVGYLLWAAPSDYVDIVHQPAVFSQTEIFGNEPFRADIESKATVVQDLPNPIKAQIFSFRYIAKNKATGETKVLNPAYSVRIEPFPLKKGESFVTSKHVSMQFPTGTASGDYVVIEEMTGVETVKPDAPSRPTAPTKPPEPTQPSAPQEPSAPTKPSAPTGSGGAAQDGVKPAEPQAPTKPSEPPKPSEPEKPSEPMQPPAPTSTAESFIPPTPRELGTVRYLASRSPAPSNAFEFTISPSSVPNAQRATGKITLPAPASAGGQVVMLSASPASLVTIPASLMVKAGSTTATFDILTRKMNLPAMPVAVTIKAVASGFVRSAELVVTPPFGVSSLGVAPSPLTNGETAVGMVVLNTTSTSDGLQVFLSASPGNLVSMPSVVVIKKGQIFGSFAIRTKTVIQPTNVTISASTNRIRFQKVLLRINPTPKASALTVSPSTVSAGGRSTGLVVLTAPATGGGQVVTLTAVPSSAASVPSSIRIPPGATTGTFSIQSKSVPKLTGVTLSAAANGVRKTAVLTVVPLALSSLDISPSSALDGTATTGTVTLNGPAPAGGITIRLTAAPASLVVLPASISIPEGEKTATFGIQAKKPPLPENVVVSAILGNVKKTATLTVGSTVTPTSCPYVCREGYLESYSSWSGPKWAAKCAADEVAEYRATCPSVTKSYSCGTWGRSTCWAKVNSVCCKPKF